MGVVYEAEEVSLGRRVALKVLPYAAMLDERQLQRFKNEARIAATLDHPNIVTVHAIGIASGVHYYAMQLIDGLNLADVIKELRHLQSADNGLAVANPSHELANRLSHGKLATPEKDVGVPTGGDGDPELTIDHSLSPGTGPMTGESTRRETTAAAQAAISRIIRNPT